MVKRLYIVWLVFFGAFLQSAGQNSGIWEYWFNDDYNDKVSIETNGSDSLQLNAALQTTHLANGMHWIHFRVKDNLGVYSPLQSHLFWKTGQKLVAYEFWYDDNFNSRSAGHISGVKEESWIKIVELDAVNFEKISARYKDSGGLWSSVVSLDVSESVSAMAFERHRNFSIYPNPVADKLTISYVAETGESAVFTIYVMQGKKVLIQNLGVSTGAKQHQMIDVTRLINGIYLCVFETESERSVFKAVTNR